MWLFFLSVDVQILWKSFSSCETTALLRKTSPGTLAKPGEKILFYFPLAENWGQKFRTKRIISHLLTLYSYSYICNLQLIFHGEQLQRNTSLFSFTDCRRLSCAHLPSFLPCEKENTFYIWNNPGHIINFQWWVIRFNCNFWTTALLCLSALPFPVSLWIHCFSRFPLC